MERTLMMLGRPFYEVGEVDNLIGAIAYNELEQEGISSILPSYAVRNFTSIESLKMALRRKEISHILATAMLVQRKQS